MASNEKKNSLKARLKNRYRLVVLNDDTFEERIAFRLTPLRVLVSIASTIIVLIILVISLVAFTPLREYIPGYGDVGEKRKLMELSARADSIEESMKAKDWFIQNLQNVLAGNTEGKPEKPQKDTNINYARLNVRPSKNDSLLRYEIEAADKYSLALTDKSKALNSISSFVFFSPVKGIISSSFSLREEHFGVDIAAKENEFIKATLDGTVVFAGFTNADGYVIQLQHNNNLMSVYKHNSELMVRVGDYVKAGKPIAIIGNTGETSNGPHLHFELWYNGSPINPQDYILF